MVSVVSLPRSLLKRDKRHYFKLNGKYHLGFPNLFSQCIIFVSFFFSAGGCFGPQGARAWLFAGFVMGFAAVIASFWILFSGFISQKGVAVGPGFELLFQNVFIFAASLVYKFGRQEDQWS